ncbi:MAG: DNA alkylation repair protein [Phycisphaerales bacterium]|nr:DNA alkylation repair protein [Phycisphaerales bacterium]
MPSTIAGAAAVNDVLAELESLGDEKRRRHNARVGPDGIAGVPLEKQFGCRTGDIRKLAKKIKTDHELGQKLWKTGNMDAQLLAILIMKPKALSASQLDTMVRETRFSWVVDWLQSYIIKEQPDDEKEGLRRKWMKKNEKDSWAARAGWHLTASKINRGEDGVDVEALLDRIEKEMPGAEPETKWTMNNTLGAIGIKHAEHRSRAIAIGERIGLYEDWPVSKGCTIPYVPVWIDAVVKRKS